MLFACFGWFWRFRLGFTRGKKYHWAPKPIIIYMPALNVFLRVSGFRRFRVGLIEGNNYHWAPKPYLLSPPLMLFGCFGLPAISGCAMLLVCFGLPAISGWALLERKFALGPKTLYSNYS